MGSQLLSNPLFNLCMLYFAALLLAAFWPRARVLPVQGEGRSRRVCEQADSRLPTPADRGPGLAPLRDRSASRPSVYPARFSQAIQRIQKP
jgi:hypothetical protein